MRYLYTQPSSRKFKALQSYETKNESNTRDQTRWRNKRKTGSQNGSTTVTYQKGYSKSHK